MKRGLMFVFCLSLLLVLSLSVVSAEIRFKQNWDKSIEAVVNLKDSGSISFGVLYGDDSNQFLGIGKDSQNRLATATNVRKTIVQRDSSGNSVNNFFTVGSFELKARVERDSIYRNVTDIINLGTGETVCEDKKKGEFCNIGNIKLIIEDISYTGAGLQSVDFLITSDSLKFISRDSSGNRYHKYFIASFQDSMFPESYLLEALITRDQTTRRNLTSIYKIVTDEAVNRKMMICSDKRIGDVCHTGNIDLTMENISYGYVPPRFADISGGSNVDFNRVYDTEGNYFFLPSDDEFPTTEYTFDVFDKSGQKIIDWTAYFDSEGNARIKRNLPDFDSVEVVYASSFIASPINVDTSNWLTQLATKKDGSIGNLEVVYGVINLVKDEISFRERFISLNNIENKSIKKQFLFEDGQTIYFHDYLDTEDGRTFYGDRFLGLEIRDLFGDGRKIIGNQLIEDYTQPIKTATLFNNFTLDPSQELTSQEPVLEGISLYSQFGSVWDIQFLDFPRPDTNYWKADMSTLIQVGNPVI